MFSNLEMYTTEEQLKINQLYNNNNRNILLFSRQQNLEDISSGLNNEHQAHE